MQVRRKGGEPTSGLSGGGPGGGKDNSDMHTIEAGADPGSRLHNRYLFRHAVCAVVGGPARQEHPALLQHLYVPAARHGRRREKHRCTIPAWLERWGSFSLLDRLLSQLPLAAAVEKMSRILEQYTSTGGVGLNTVKKMATVRVPA